MDALTYRQQGDYELPNLIMGETFPTGKWAKMKATQLKEQHYPFYLNLLTRGELSAYLQTVQDQAEKRLEQLIPKLATAQGIDEALKAADPIAWTQQMNAIMHQAETIVKAELINT